MACDPLHPDAHLYLQDALNALVGAFSTVNGDFSTATKQEVANILLAQIAGGIPLSSGAATEAKQTFLPGLSIPTHDNIVCTYFGVTNNFQTIVYKLGAAVVNTLTFTYIGGGILDDDDVATIVKT